MARTARENHLEFMIKLKSIEYAHFVVEGGKGPGGTVGLSYATRAMGISDKATLVSWIKNQSNVR